MTNTFKQFFTYHRILLFLVVCGLGIGVIWRVYLVDKFILWAEELWVYFFASQPISYIQFLFFPLDDRPPIYYLIIKFLTYFSKEEIILRLPSLLSGVYLLASLTRFIWQRQKIWAVIISFLGANYYFFVVSATQARDYGLMVLVAWMQISLAWKMLEKLSLGLEAEDLKLKKWWSWSLLSIIGVGLNYAYLPFLGSIWLSLIILIYLFWHDFKHQNLIKSWLVRYVFSLLPAGLFAFYYLFIANQFSYLLSTTSYILKPGWIEVVSLAINLFGLGVTQKIVSDPGIISSQVSMLIFGFLLLLIGWSKAWKIKKWRNFFVFGSTSFILNLGVILVATYFSNTSFFLTRFFAPISVICFLLMTLAIYQIWLSTNYELKKYIIIFLVAIYSPLYLFQLNQRENIYGEQYQVRKENRRFIEIIAGFLKSDDQLIILPNSKGRIYLSYYFEDDIYVNNQKLLNFLKPTSQASCLLPEKLDLKPGAKLYLAVTDQSYQQGSTSITIYDGSDIYPNKNLDLSDLCTTNLKPKVIMLNTAIWSCELKSPLFINRYSYIDA